MPKPKIVLVGGDGRPSGVPRHILHLVDALDRYADIIVISDRDEGGYTPLARTSARHKVVRGLTKKPSLTHQWRGISGLISAISDQQPDLIWVHARLQVLVLRILLTLRLWRPACPVAFTHHGMPYGPGYPFWIHKLSSCLEQLLIACSSSQDLVFLNLRMAGWMARDASAKRLARHRVHTLPNCSNLRPIPASRDKSVKRIVMTGRTGHQKDYDTAVRVLEHLPRNYRLNLCGPGTDEPDFQTHIATLVPSEIFAKIEFSGPLPDVRHALSQADAYLLTSRYEGTPIGALEAFEAGLPIILRNFDGAEDLISKHPCSLMIECADLAQDGREITALLERYEANRHVFSEAIKNVWQHTWSTEIFNKNVLTLVQSILNRPIVPAAVTDYIHDGPALLPDLSKTADAPFPTPPPSNIDAAPSAVNV
ncbi:glycosyltransferase involved in cell wall biosynthesis [Sulfitobacter noctilucicola]|uniref:Glycosyltransferase involved in cell wall biosynthesis n=1 Tax=Sulfitobacter noctilucicola TaxID=1342301 RepID=A0A7W6M5R4_9RHOB|nr:glycosyltransferase involved in cell wall biosynthesis [Sulfitobacter noctilucicola]